MKKPSLRDRYAVAFCSWSSVDSAPIDGRVIYARGRNYGRQHERRHYVFTRWDDRQQLWVDPDNAQKFYTHLQEWKPTTEKSPENSALRPTRRLA